ncbi:hypothetical protein [Undibacter mobilis]|uniref:Dolichyl-phosphate-mannose-protein mannosyltransferase n=1 Tax=Undibacter mobilis TaxID=2292256 RepID=A0A371BD83_9BRAD|nr:hypothetical protein [Undibacter mobilis]RDV05559.1 hypothetical protein DXH78_13835 [Undibacter mobilis]
MTLAPNATGDIPPLPVDRLLRRVLAAGLVAIALVLLLQPLFVGLLVATRSASDLPAIRGHIVQAFADGYLANDEQPTRFMHGGGHQFTECAGLLVAIDPESDPLIAALRPVMHSPYVGPCGEVESLAKGVATDKRTDYARYWHGYRVYLWPMLSVFSLETVRMINLVLLYAATAFYFIGMRRAIGATPALAFFIVQMSLTDIWRMWNITTHTLSTILILAGAGLFAFLYPRTRNLTLAIVMAAAFGAVFNFVDFLINPPLMPMLLAFIVIATELKSPMPIARQTVIPALLMAGFVALAWFGGYGVTWATEWLLAVWMSPDGQQAGLSIIKQIALRLYGVEADSVVPMYPLIPTLTMILQSFISVGSVVVAALAAAMFVFLRAHWQAFDWRRFLLLSWPTLIAMAWFEILNNHTQTHSHFTYRSESAAIAMVFAAALLATNAQATIKSLFGDLWRVIRQRPAQAPAA